MGRPSGLALRLLHCPDEPPGHDRLARVRAEAGLPQLAASGGALRYYHHRCNPGQEDLWPAYWWEGQDGTRILAISTHTYNGDIHARDLAPAAIRARAQDYQRLFDQGPDQ